MAYSKEVWSRYYKKNRDKVLGKNKEYRDSNKHKEKNRRLIWNYGITLDQYEVLLKEQNNKCALCDKEDKLVVDHCHNSGNIRGLLCRDCNLALGLFKDNLETLEKASKYIETANSWI